MADKKTQAWVAGTAVVSLLVLVATWFLGVSPKLDEAADTQSQNDDALTQQAILTTRLAELKEQATHLDEFKQQLAGLRAQMPAAPQLSDVTREVTSLAESRGLVITNMAPGVPTLYTSATSQTPTAADPKESAKDTAAGAEDAANASAGTDAADDKGSGDDASGGDATAETPAPTPPSGPTVPTGLENLVVVPISVTVVGTYASAMDFVNAVQTGATRLYLVAGISSASQSPTEASGGRPPTQLGDVEMTVSFIAWVLPTDETAPVDPNAAPPDTTLPSTERNPFSPVTG